MRPDVTAAMVVSLVGAHLPGGRAHAGAAPAGDLLAIVCDGLRPQAAEPHLGRRAQRSRSRGAASSP